MTTITVQPRQGSGTYFDPVDEGAKALAAIAHTKTLRWGDLRLASEVLGLEVVIRPAFAPIPREIEAQRAWLDRNVVNLPTPLQPKIKIPVVQPKRGMLTRLFG